MANVLIENLSKRFGETLAVDHLNLEVRDKEFVCLLGPTGCGKTTTFRMIAGVETPDEGKIYLGESLVNDLSPSERDIAMVFQSFALFPNKTAYENLALPLEAKKVPKDQINKKVKEVAETLRITHLLNKIPAHLSGGERQRVALGGALVRSPQLYLLDEPLTNLDAKLRAQMRAELKRLQKEIGQTTIFSTPDQVEALAMADRIAVMDHGKLQQYDTPESVYYKPESLFVAGFIGSPAMNFLDCTFLKKDKKAILDTGAFTIDVSNLRALIEKESTGPELILGVRPEDITLTKTKTNKNTYEVEIYVIEHLKPETVVDVEMGGNIIKVTMPTTFEADIGDKVWMTLNKERIHVIDKKTEKVIV